MSTPPTKAGAEFAKGLAEAIRGGLRANGWTSLGKVSGRMFEEWTAAFYDDWEARATARVKPGKGAPKLAPMPRAKVDALYLVLCELAAYNVPEMGKDLKTATALALNEIRRSTPKVDEPEIRRRAVRYLRQFPGLRFTPPGLAKHWAACGGAPPKPSMAALAECPDWRRILGESAYRVAGGALFCDTWAELPADVKARCGAMSGNPTPSPTQ